MSGNNAGQSGALVHAGAHQQVAVKPVDQLRGQLSAMSSEFRNALPGHIKPEKFQRVVMTVVQQTPELMAADRRSLLASCIKCAADGLVPDGREAALVIFNVKIKDKASGKEHWEKRVQYMPMLAGLQKRVRNSGEISSIEAHVIHEQDQFVWRQGMDGTIQHTPKFPGSRGKPIGAYAIAKFKDGSTPMFEVMDFDEIERVRAVSKSKDGGPWVQWWGEMARKTVFRRLQKWLPAAADVDDLLRRDDENEAASIQIAPTDSGSATGNGSSKLDVLEGAVVDYDDETGEIIEDENPDLAAIRADIAGSKTRDELTALDANGAFKARLKKLSEDERTEVKKAQIARMEALGDLPSREDAA